MQDETLVDNLSIAQLVELLLTKAVKETAQKTAEAILDELANRNEDTWLTYEDFKKKKGVSRHNLNNMMTYGLTRIKDGKVYKFNLAEYYEVKRLMNQER